MLPSMSSFRNINGELLSKKSRVVIMIPISPALLISAILIVNSVRKRASKYSSEFLTQFWYLSLKTLPVPCSTHALNEVGQLGGPQVRA